MPEKDLVAANIRLVKCYILMSRSAGSVKSMLAALDDETPRETLELSCISLRLAVLRAVISASNDMRGNPAIKCCSLGAGPNYGPSFPLIFQQPGQIRDERQHILGQQETETKSPCLTPSPLLLQTNKQD